MVCGEHKVEVQATKSTTDSTQWKKNKERNEWMNEYCIKRKCKNIIYRLQLMEAIVLSHEKEDEWGRVNESFKK